MLGVAATTDEAVLAHLPHFLLCDLVPKKPQTDIGLWPWGCGPLLWTAPFTSLTPLSHTQMVLRPLSERGYYEDLSHRTLTMQNSIALWSA